MKPCKRRNVSIPAVVSSIPPNSDADSESVVILPSQHSKARELFRAMPKFDIDIPSLVEAVEPMTAAESARHTVCEQVTVDETPRTDTNYMRMLRHTPLNDPHANTAQSFDN